MRTWLIALMLVLSSSITMASDHLDTPSVIADPAADIADLYAWMSPDGRRLNLVMTLVAHQFSDKLHYAFHVDSGKRFGKTTATTSIVCRFAATGEIECWAGDADYVRGDASNEAGLEGRKHRFRVFAGLRADPFFNNVKGTRAALNAASAAVQKGTPLDASGCPAFDAATSKAILDLWRLTEGGPAKNTLAGWKSAALVISIDLDVVNRGGNLLAAWSGVYKPARTPAPALGTPIDRMGRALTGNALIGPLAPGDVSHRRKETYNAASPLDWPQFAEDFALTLALYDGFDGACGNQWIADRKATSSTRYRDLAAMLADDRLWINSASTVCKEYLAVERVEHLDLTDVAIFGSPASDCGGRTPTQDAPDVFRSLLAGGISSSVSDGINSDDETHSTINFPFLARP